MLYAVLDCAAIGSREALHAELAARLQLPAWYGGNLDALHDCLTEPREETRILLLSPDALSETLGDYAQRFFRVLEDCAAENAKLEIRRL